MGLLPLQEEHGGAGVYSMDLRKLYRLQNAEWNHDIIPEIVDGHNIADFVDLDIETKLLELDLEEDELAEEWLREVRHPLCKPEQLQHLQAFALRICRF